MTTDTVSAADLAAALRRTVPYLHEAHDFLSGYSDTEDQLVEIDYLEDLIPSLLDRWDAQCREWIAPAIAACERAKQWDMSRARDESGDDRLWRVEQARKANWEIILLRRQLRALGGDV